MSRPKSCRTEIIAVQLIAALVFPSAVSSLISPPIEGEVSTLLLDQRDGRRRAERDRVGDRTPELLRLIDRPRGLATRGGGAAGGAACWQAVSWIASSCATS